MKDELFKIANMLMALMSKKDRDVINVFKHNINNGNLDTARIISDELADHFTEIENRKASLIANELYDRTMQYYELNSN